MSERWIPGTYQDGEVIPESPKTDQEFMEKSVEMPDHPRVEIHFGREAGAWVHAKSKGFEVVIVDMDQVDEEREGGSAYLLKSTYENGPELLGVDDEICV